MSNEHKLSAFMVLVLSLKCTKAGLFDAAMIAPIACTMHGLHAGLARLLIDSSL